MAYSTRACRSAAAAVVAAAMLVVGAAGAQERPAAVATLVAPSAATTRPASPGGWPAASGAAATRPAVRVEEAVLYAKPVDAAIADTTASPDCRHVACVERRGERTFQVVVDGVRLREVEWIVARTLRFSPDGGRFAFQTQHDGQMFVAVGSSADPAAAAEGPGYFLVGRPLFSPDGAHVAYWAQAAQAGKTAMVVDGVARGSYDVVDEAQALYSPDAKRLAYRATRGRQQFFVIDETEGPAYDVVVGGRFSHDGRRFGYRAKRGDQTFAVIDGRPGPAYDLVAGLTFSKDGRRAAYAAGRGDKQMLVVVDDAPSGGGPARARQFLPFDGLGDIAFSPDGRRLAITALVGKQWRAIVDGQEGPPFDGTGPILFSPDSRRFAYVVGRDGRQALVTDGREGPAFTGIGTYTFTPDARHVVYAVINNEQTALLVDDQSFAAAGLFAFSPDGRHIVHSVPLPDKKWVLAVDGVPVGGAPDRPVGATPARPAGEAGPNVYDGFPAGSDLVFDHARTARTIVARGTTLLRVQLHLSDE